MPVQIAVDWAFSPVALMAGVWAGHRANLDELR
jgi:hypothetical protein